VAQRNKRIPPHNIEAEAALLGAIMLRSSNLDEVSRIVTSQDFYKPSHRIIYGALLDLWRTGKPTDPVTVSDEIKARGWLDRIGGSATLATLMAVTPSIGSAVRYAEIVVRMATYRRAIEVANGLAEAAYDMDADPNDLIDEAKRDLLSIGVRLGDVPDDLWRLDDFLGRPDADRPEWCIPGLIREGWRVIIVATEGLGKSQLQRQLAILSAQGIHPLRFCPMDPCRTLIVDLENPDDAILDNCIPINEKVKARSTVNYDADRAWLWHRPSGINLRHRADRIAFETIIDQIRPKLVCLGPLYKAYEVGARENDELASREIMAVLDDLRTRYRFGLIMEHHAPKETAGAKRKLMPYGSSLWLRWPEIGINLYPEEGNSFDRVIVGRWRGDRLDNEWPEKLDRGMNWPWVGVWPTGFLNAPPGEAIVRRDPIMEPLDDLLPPNERDSGDNGDDYDRF
jgi:replicative DNA helicase